MPSTATAPKLRPEWLPASVQLYLDHTKDGLSLRELARREGCHASTVLRRVRRTESRRDDPLLDEALTALSRLDQPPAPDQNRKDDPAMSVPIRKDTLVTDDATIEREARRILRRLAEPGAMLAIAPDLEKAVVLRETAEGAPTRTAVVDRAVAQAFALRDWIASRKTGRVAAYEITPLGRMTLRRLIELHDHSGLAEAAAEFTGPGEGEGEDAPRRGRVVLAESPVSVLGRRRDKDGRPFLEAELVRAAERLREDFESAQTGARGLQNWDTLLSAGARAEVGGAAPRAARDRVAAALRDLGPGLGDVVLRVCCYLEGIETAERRMGWASRSGKIVLRIALQRLRRHYDETYGRSGPLIG